MGNISKNMSKPLLFIFFVMLISLTLSCAGPSSVGNILICSSSSEGQIGNFWSMNPSISADGRYVTFESSAGNLTPYDEDLYEESITEVYRKDLETGEILLCSATISGDPGDRFNENPSISSDGRYVAFDSNADNLIPDDNNDCYDVFRKDLETGEIIRCSTSVDGKELKDNCQEASLSSDGRYVVFVTVSKDLYPGEKDEKWFAENVYRKDLETGEIVCCSIPKSGRYDESNGVSPHISADGRYVAFVSTSSYYVDGDINMQADVFRCDLQTGEIICCSAAMNGEVGNAASWRPSISADGKYVAFDSVANNLAKDANSSNGSAVYRKDCDTGEIIICSASSRGETGNGEGWEPSISADGRLVAFSSSSDDIVDGDKNGQIDIFVRDLESGETTLCSSSSSGKAGNGESGSPCLSADGKYVVFQSASSNLAKGNKNNEQVYRKFIEL